MDSHVVVRATDALRSDFVDRYPTPNFHRLIDRGVRAKTMQPVFPSLTFPNHYSIVTGALTRSIRMPARFFRLASSTHVARTNSL